MKPMGVAALFVGFLLMAGSVAAQSTPSLNLEGKGNLGPGPGACVAAGCSGQFTATLSGESSTEQLADRHCKSICRSRIDSCVRVEAQFHARLRYRVRRRPGYPLRQQQRKPGRSHQPRSPDQGASTTGAIASE